MLSDKGWMVVALLVAVLGVAVIVVVVFRFKRSRARLRRPSDPPAYDSDGPR